MCFRERETKHDYFEEAIWVVNVYFFEMNFFFFFMCMLICLSMVVLPRGHLN